MPCYSPLRAWKGGLTESGKKKLVFKKQEAHGVAEIELPCGNCIGCRLDRARQWAARCWHESQMHKENSFVTLTFNDENVQKNGSLEKESFVNFMKRLRKNSLQPVRFFHCGEYGTKLSRPHHHALLFGRDFPDKQLWKQSNGQNWYRSEELEKLWPFGFSTVGDVTQESANYVARYILKKVNGEQAEKHYDGKMPEYITMSRRPGIGKSWLEKYQSDVFPHDHVVVGGREAKPPRYYDKQLEIRNPSELDGIKARRVVRATEKNRKEEEGKKGLQFHSKLERLKIGETVQTLRQKQITRPLEG